MEELARFMPEINKLDYYLKKFLPESDKTAREWMEYILEGNTILEPTQILRKVFEMIRTNLQEWKQLFVSIILLFVISALVNTFMETFKSANAVKITKLIFVLGQLLILIKIWKEMEEIAHSSIEELLAFMKIAMPAFMTCIAITGNITTSVIFQKLILGTICVMEGMLLTGIFPLLKIYISFSVVEVITGEGRFQTLLELIKRTIHYITKGCIWVIGASQSIQLLITPVIDKNNIQIAKKTVGAIPGIGDITESVTSITVASLIAVKNSFGIVILLILVTMTITPVIKIFGLVWTLKISGAIGSICGDASMMKGINYIAEAGLLALRILIMFTTLFLVTIALLTNTIGG